MKTFEDICRMTQVQVKAYMSEYLVSKKYDVINEDGFLYAKGDLPILLVAHMDTVHKLKCGEIHKKDGKWSSPQGIGGDDRCGIFIIMNLVKEFHCSVLLCEDEEIGGVGARKFTKATYERLDENNKVIKGKYIDNLDVHYMVEFDRKGNNDAVFYSCDNKDFTDFVTDFTGFKFAYGSFSDISVLMPASKIAGVNLSSGYYNAHTTDEYVVYDEMMDTVEAAKALIKAGFDGLFEYVPKKYDYSNKKYDYRSYKEPSPIRDMGMVYDYSLYDLAKHRDQTLYEIAKKDLKVEIEVIIRNIEDQEEVFYAQGNTKPECWMNLFMENPDLCWNDITTYSWC